MLTKEFMVRRLRVGNQLPYKSSVTQVKLCCKVPTRKLDGFPLIWLCFSNSIGMLPVFPCWFARLRKMEVFLPAVTVGGNSALCFTDKV